MAVDVALLARRADAVRSRTTLSAIVGADVTLIKQGKEHGGICPFHADTKRGNFSVNDAKGIFKCFACGEGGDVIDYLRLRKGLSFVQALKMLEADAGIDFRDAKQRADFDRKREKDERREAEAAEKRRINAAGLWLHAAPIAGTPAQSYLQRRGIDFARIGRLPGALRFRHDCWNAEMKRPMPAMVAKMTGLDGTHRATHRTFLELRRGRWEKAAIDKPKTILGRWTGAHIALHKGDSGRAKLADVPDGTAIHASEGIEDGLTVAMADPAQRVIAAGVLGNLGAIELPDQVSDVVLIGQRDADWRALRAAAARARGDMAEVARQEKAAAEIERAFNRQIAMQQEAGRTVLCMWPDEGFKDVNDQLRGIRMEAA